MKNLIIEALNEAYEKVCKQVPQVKREGKSVKIEDISPSNLLDFIKENNIPANAEFGAEYNSPVLEWEIDVPTTDKDKEDFKIKRFTDVAFRCVYDKLTNNGFKRVGYSTRFLDDFKNTTVYKMYLENDFDRLEKYYSLPFQKIED